MQNMEYVRTLLKQKQPEFAAALEVAADLVRQELQDQGARPGDWHVRARLARLGDWRGPMSPALVSS
jgi:hypothetical protein